MAISAARPTRIGRFAPSPTGQLHFGSLLSAVASYLDCLHQNGQWLIRVEDIDPPREVAGSASSIINDLTAWGMHSDAPVLFQSSRLAAYDAAIQRLLASGQAYWCGCSRKDLPPSGIYPGTCRRGIAAGRKPRAIRLRVNGRCIRFSDRIQGPRQENLAESVGDFIIQRADGLPAYQLAVVVDDAFQGVTDVVRGADLLDSTARQIFLQHCLELPTPRYAHLPLIRNADGSKLSKRTQSDPISQWSAAPVLEKILRLLGQQPLEGAALEPQWQHARENWNPRRIPTRIEV